MTRLWSIGVVAALALAWWLAAPRSQDPAARNQAQQKAMHTLLETVEQALASDFAWLNDAQTAFIVRDQTPMPLCGIQNVVPQVDRDSSGQRLLLSTTDPAVAQSFGTHSHVDAQGVTHYTKAVPLFDGASFGGCHFIAEATFLGQREWIIVLLAQGLR
ncbi:MAG: hypothetical protein Q4G71_08385 [Pseudomonadota bacterium]|nr:hypothetical protein [Pseudomonadota bacterium]